MGASLGSYGDSELGVSTIFRGEKLSVSGRVFGTPSPRIPVVTHDGLP